MSEKPVQVNSNGIGFFGLLGLLFIGLKLGNVISWSWWLVLLPLYGPVVLVLAVFVVFLVVYGLAGCIIAFYEFVRNL